MLGAPLPTRGPHPPEPARRRPTLARGAPRLPRTRPAPARLPALATARVRGAAALAPGSLRPAPRGPPFAPALPGRALRVLPSPPPPRRPPLPPGPPRSYLLPCRELGAPGRPGARGLRWRRGPGCRKCQQMVPPREAERGRGGGRRPREPGGGRRRRGGRKTRAESPRGAGAAQGGPPTGCRFSSPPNPARAPGLTPGRPEVGTLR